MWGKVHTKSHLEVETTSHKTKKFINEDEKRNHEGSKKLELKGI